MSENCIFCKIVAGQATAALVYQDGEVTVFRDQRPAAPIHLLIVPNKHITSFNRIGEEDAGLLAHMLFVARKLAEQNNVSQDGYRLVINTGPDAGQTVFHLHLHLLAGQRLSGLGHSPDYR
jgi:histidine triad (HIT) family protein